MLGEAVSPPYLPRTWLREAIAEARRTWPGVAVSDDAFAQHVTRHATDGDASSLRIPDLFVAYACSCLDPAALSLFEAAYFDEVDVAARRFRSLPIGADDLRQRVRQRLFLGDEGKPPALAGYAGRGELRSWLRAAVLHMLLNISSRESREQPTDGAFFEAVLDTTADAEAACLKQACREEFKAAFDAALGRLTPRERTLLQYAFADGLDVDGIGAIFGVHRATAARWVAKARERLVTETRADLMARLAVDEWEAASILRAALSKIGPTLLGRLG